MRTFAIILALVLAAGSPIETEGYAVLARTKPSLTVCGTPTYAPYC